MHPARFVLLRRVVGVCVDDSHYQPVLSQSSQTICSSSLTSASAAGVVPLRYTQHAGIDSFLHFHCRMCLYLTHIHTCSHKHKRSENENAQVNRFKQSAPRLFISRLVTKDTYHPVFSNLTVAGVISPNLLYSSFTFSVPALLHISHDPFLLLTVLLILSSLHVHNRALLYFS